MNINIQEKIEKISQKLLTDKTLMSRFEKNPASVIEELVGVDLPDELVNKVVDGVKAKIAAGKVGEALSGLGKLIGK